MNIIDKKRENFLICLERSFNAVNYFNRFTGPGIIKKLQRLLHCPQLYLPYLYKRLLVPRKKLRIRLFYGKEVVILPTKSLPSFLIGGILPHEAEYKLTKFFIKNLKENDIFYDIGANYGFYTYLALEFCKEIHSFEPLPEVFENLKFNLKDYKNVFLNNFALGNRKDTSVLYLPYSEGIDPYESSTLIKDVIEVHNYNYQKKILVRIETLENYLKSHNLPTVIKLDVEGAESLVIDGGYEFFRESSPIIAMEVWPSEKGGEISMKAVEKLRSLGYKSYFLDKNGNLNLCKKNLSEIVDAEGLTSDNFVFKKE